MKRDNPQIAYETDNFRRRCQSSTALSHLQGPTHTRRVSCSGCHGEEIKGRLKILPPLGLARVLASFRADDLLCRSRLVYRLCLTCFRGWLAYSVNGINIARKYQ